ncbi:MAG: hypothetical protein O2857_31285, partial [Planctomycetota bacterium]|nr:hypothetical protein [Planctomycetota bacterium]
TARCEVAEPYVADKLAVCCYRRNAERYFFYSDFPYVGQFVRRKIQVVTDYHRDAPRLRTTLVLYGYRLQLGETMGHRRGTNHPSKRKRSRALFQRSSKTR